MRRATAVFTRQGVCRRIYWLATLVPCGRFSASSILDASGGAGTLAHAAKRVRSKHAGAATVTKQHHIAHVGPVTG